MGKKSFHHKHPYMEALESFGGRIIEVKDVFGEVYRGECIAIYKQHLNVILKVDGQFIVIKNPQVIRSNVK